jgi:hypothetical protein
MKAPWQSWRWEQTGMVRPLTRAVAAADGAFVWGWEAATVVATVWAVTAGTAALHEPSSAITAAAVAVREDRFKRIGSSTSVRPLRFRG